MSPKFPWRVLSASQSHFNSARKYAYWKAVIQPFWTCLQFVMHGMQLNHIHWKARPDQTTGRERPFTWYAFCPYRNNDRLSWESRRLLARARLATIRSSTHYRQSNYTAKRHRAVIHHHESRHRSLYCHPLKSRTSRHNNPSDHNCSGPGLSIFCVICCAEERRNACPWRYLIEGVRKLFISWRHSWHE